MDLAKLALPTGDTTKHYSSILYARGEEMLDCIGRGTARTAASLLLGWLGPRGAAQGITHI